ncbi:MAG: hypothetical protein JXB25_05155 [Deltaproteobacteria bacterium]|nr:hypothetical protein [Deltaproteobacteria bacterium]
MVLIIEKDGTALYASDDDMLQQAGDINASRSGHAEKIAENVKISRTSPWLSRWEAWITLQHFSWVLGTLSGLNWKNWGKMAAGAKLSTRRVDRVLP